MTARSVGSRDQERRKERDSRKLFFSADQILSVMMMAAELSVFPTVKLHILNGLSLWLADLLMIGSQYTLLAGLDLDGIHLPQPHHYARL